MSEPTRAVCARCGHQAGRCPHCARRDPFLGGYIEGRRYCHTFVDQPSCYTVRMRERHDELMARYWPGPRGERPRD